MNKVHRLLPVCLLLLASRSAFAQPTAPVSKTASTVATQAASSTPQAEAVPAPKASPDSGYNFIVYPVLAWLPVMGVDFTLPDNPNSDASAGPSGAAFVAFRWEMGRFAVSSDFNWAGATAERTSPNAVVKLDTASAAILGGFKVVNGLYVEGGARYRGLDVRASVNDNPEVTWKPSRWDPAIGATFRPQLGGHWRLYSHIDWAGTGGDKLSTVNGGARIEWVPLRHLALTGGYAFATARANGEIGSKPIHVSYTFHGPVVGFGLPF